MTSMSPTRSTPSASARRLRVCVLAWGSRSVTFRAGSARSEEYSGARAACRRRCSRLHDALGLVVLPPSLPVVHGIEELLRLLPLVLGAGLCTLFDVVPRDRLL